MLLVGRSILAPFLHRFSIAVLHRTMKTKQVGACNYSDLRLLLERATGVEPASSAWKAEVLPMNYARECGRDDRI